MPGADRRLGARHRRRRCWSCGTWSSTSRSGAAGCCARDQVVRAVDGVSLRPAGRRDARPGRRVRLRQVHHRPADHPAARADRRARSSSRAPTSPTCTERDLRPYRRELQLIFQDPYSSLNPRHTVGTIVGTRAAGAQHRARRARSWPGCRSCSRWSGLNPEHYNRYPHEFSGGQRQRIGIARALAAQPEGHRRRRAGQRAGRVDPGPGDEPAGGPAQASSASRSSSSPTTWAWSGTSATGSRSCTWAGSSRSAPRDADLRRAAAPVHPGAAVGRARPRRGPRHAAEGAHPAGRRRAQPGRPAVGLPVPHPVLEGRRTSAPPPSRRWRRRPPRSWPRVTSPSRPASRSWPLVGPRGRPLTAGWPQWTLPSHWTCGHPAPPSVGGTG